MHAGRTLQAGDLLALGSLGPSVAAPPPGRLEAVFQTPFGNGRVIFALR
jgi:2-keto-4-pentenoate hydratase